MRARIIAVLAATALAVAGCESTTAVTAAPVETDFTLMVLNIEYGGDEVDFDKIIEAIEKADPDVVALEEAEGNTAAVAEALGWPYHSIRSQIVSTLPLIDPPGANGNYEFVEIQPGAVVAITNVHLPSDPYGPYDVRDGKTLDEVLQLERDTRLAAIQPKLDAIAALPPDIPVFLLGDFNAPSHLDWTEAAVGLRPHILYAVPWPVSVAVEEAGFRDPYRELHPDPVVDPGLTWWAGRPLIDGYPDPSEPQDRIDIIYASGPSTTNGIRIVGELGGPQVDIEVDPWGTDHRGVVADFTLTPGVPTPFVSVDQRPIVVGDTPTVRYLGDASSAESQFVSVIGSTDPTVLIEHPLDEALAGSWNVSDLTPGEYHVRLVAGENVLATTQFSVFEAGVPTTIGVDQNSFTAGEPIMVFWYGGPGARWDWIGVFPRGADPLDGDYRFYVYTDQAMNGSVVLDENGEGEWPIPPGDYDVHYLVDDGYVSLASAPFTVTP